MPALRNENRAVLIVAEAFENLAGTEIYIRHLAQGLAGKGWAVTLCLLGGCDDLARLENAKYSCFDDICQLSSFSQLTMLIRANDYQVINNHLYTNLLKALWYEKRARPTAKIVNTWHLSLSAWGYKIYIQWIASVVIADATLGVAKHVFNLKSGVSLYQLIKSKCHYVYSWKIARKVGRITEKTYSSIIFCGCGRLSKEKNWMTLLKAINHLHQTGRVSPANFAFVLMGDGPLRFELEEYSRSHYLNELVTFKGQVDAETVIEVMSNAHVLILPSMHEAFPLVVIEAMSQGLGVLASNIPAIREIFGECYEHHVFPVVDYERLASMMHNLLSNPERLNACVKSTLDCYEAICHYTDFIDYYYKFFTDIVINKQHDY